MSSTTPEGAPRVTVTRLAGQPGRPVLVLGPSLGTSVERLWGVVAEQLADDFDVLGWDLPGHGRSPRTTTPYDLAGLGRSVLHAVAAVGVEAPYCYAGDSVGGGVGLRLLLDRPELFRAAAVVCSAARFGTPDAWAERAALVRAEGMAPVVESSPGRWFGSIVRRQRPPVAAAALDDLARVDPESYALACEALGAFDVTARLGEITVPLLAIAGADDVATPADLHQDLARRVGSGRFAVLRGVGHLAPLEDPTRTATLLRGHFLRAAVPG